MELVYSSVVVFLIVIVGFVLVSLIISRVLQTNAPANDQKNLVYECGERVSIPAWFNFNPRFYVVALVFVIFDVETAFMFPVGVVFRDWVDAGLGHFAFLEIGIFVVILLVGLAYVWIKGDISWVKEVRSSDHSVRDLEIPNSPQDSAPTDPPSKATTG